MQSLRLFRDVARHRSLSEAATLHGITQSAASQRIHALEKRLGVTLLDRSVRPMSLTEPGRVFLEGCEDLLDRTDRLESRVRALAEAPAGQVQVHAIYSSGIGWLKDIQAAFAEVCPRVEIHVHYDRPDVIHQNVLDGRCDLGLISFAEDWAKVDALPVRDEPMVVACRPGHPLVAELTEAGREGLDLSDLNGRAMYGITRELPLGRNTMRLLRDRGAEPRVIEMFDNIDTIKAALVEAGCFAILPMRTIQREVAAGALVALKTNPTLARPVGLIHRKRRSVPGLTGPAKRFADFLVEHAKATPDTHVPDLTRPQLVATDS